MTLNTVVVGRLFLFLFALVQAMRVKVGDFLISLSRGWAWRWSASRSASSSRNRFVIDVVVWRVAGAVMTPVMFKWRCPARSP